ncbi:MAG: hypothetical protein HY051_03350 [Candidatus Aenigmarchaeota archaeon]|nr:hypothetical protein [Candidatus Aenigmarchaeota archaeon]
MVGKVIVKNLRKLIKGEKIEFPELLEEILTGLLVVGTLFLTTGIVLSAIVPAGLAALLAMSGALLSFLSLISMVVLWFAKDGFR